MSETVIITLITSLLAPVIILLIQNRITQSKEMKSLSAKIDTCIDNQEELKRDNKEQNRKIAGIQDNLDRLAHKKQFDSSILYRFIKLQVATDKMLYRCVTGKSHNGDLLEAEKNIEAFDELTHDKLFEEINK